MNMRFSISFILIIASFFNKTLAQTECNFISGIEKNKRISCGKIYVPENHNIPNGKKIQLAYAIIKSKNKSASKYPMIYFEGGPGGNALYKDFISYWPESKFSEDRDIILFDQRGVGHSSELPSMEKDFYTILASNLNAKEEEIQIKNLLIQYNNYFKSSGIKLENYNSFQIAKDIGLLMQHLGYKKYNLFGSSYGTRLARLVQMFSPEKVNSVILDAPYPLEQDFLIDRLINYDKSLSLLFKRCDDNLDCKKKYPNLRQEYLELLKQLDSKPIKLKLNEGDFYINAQDAVYFIRKQLYSGDSMEKIPLLFKELLNNGGEIIKDLIITDFKYYFNYALWIAVERFETYNNYNNTDKINQEYEKLELLPSKLGIFHSIYINMPFFHFGFAKENERKMNLSNIPTIIFANKFDPITPPENGYIMLKNLAKGQLFIVDELGHGEGNMDCKFQVFIDFINNPNQTLDTKCLNLVTQN